MRRAFTAAAIASLGLLVFLVGPKVPVDTTIHDRDLPADLDRFLSESESATGDIRAGTQKLIVWADPANRSRTPLSLVYLHGFSATRQETRPLAELIAHRLGANLFYARLRGHGRSGDALAQVSVNDWLNDAVEALQIGRRLGNKVVVIGTSTGGTLATWLASSRYSSDVLALVLLSPNFGLRDPRAAILTLPWAREIAPLIAGAEYGFEPVSEQHARYWTSRYPTVALLPVMALVELVRDSALERIELPVLILFAADDSLIDLDALRAIHARLGSRVKPLVEIGGVEDPQQHVLAGDILSPGTTNRVSDLVVDFLEDLSKSPRSVRELGGKAQNQ